MNYIGMKQIACVLLFVGISTSVFGQELPLHTSLYYSIQSDLSDVETAALGNELDLRLESYNRLFRFDVPEDRKFNVRAFESKERFDAYLTEILGSTRSGSVYLHYSRPEKSELVLFRQQGYKDRNFIHQSFIQFLRGFIPNPPSWIREGFAVFFESIKYDSVKQELVYEENLDWLDTVKKWGNSAPTLEQILLQDSTSAISAEKMTPASWALVSFLLNTDIEDYRRTLYECFMLLSAESSADENSAKCATRFQSFINANRTMADYSYYISSRKTFNELIEEGRIAYTEKRMNDAEFSFLDAASLRPSHFAPHYYLGLLAYERKDYALAENHYRSALQLGADEALVYYAMGINAIADKRTEDATSYLQTAKEKAPETYSAKADTLLERIAATR